jgi:serine/threonine protein kinase
MNSEAREWSPGSGQREDQRVLSLPFECLRSIPEGINEVRLWHDPLLDCERVGKRIELSQIEGDDALPEAATLQSIRHPNVVPVLGAAEVAGYPAPMRVIELITPFLERGSITDALLRGEQFSATEAVSITQAVLRGLAEIHEVHGICHRDMKSGNVLLCPDHRAKVADLGLAGRFDESGAVVALNNPTLYSPPEFAKTGCLTRASDIYAVGLILRELLGGPFPYADYPISLVIERINAGRTPLNGSDVALPVWSSRSMRRVYAKAVHRDPAQRFQTAQAMDEALARVTAIDWEKVDAHRWEASFLHTHRSVAVEARPMVRQGGYRLSIKTHAGRGWRRAAEDVDVPDLAGTLARNVFDHASTIASVR